MRFLLPLFYSLLLFILGLFLVFAGMNKFDRIIQELYVYIGEGQVHLAGKSILLFPSYLSLFAGGLFPVLFFLLNADISFRHRLFHFCLAVVVFALAVAIISYMDIIGRTIYCTACKDTSVTLYRSELPYSNIFVSSLVTAILPSFFMYIIRQLKTKRSTIKN